MKTFDEIREKRIAAFKAFMADKTRENLDLFKAARKDQRNWVNNFKL